MKKINLILFIFSFLLCSCATISKQELEEVERGEMAMVISNCIAYTPPVGVIIKDYSPVECSTEWIVAGGRNDGYMQTLYSSGFEPISIQVIRPGRYYLSHFNARNHDSWNGYTDIYNAKSIQNIARFDINGGEVIYLGDMQFNLRDSAIIARAISINDNSLSALKSLTKRYPALTQKFKTKLIELSPLVRLAKESKASNNSIDTNFNF